MGLSIKCVWCDKPLVEEQDAKRHVLMKCPKAPATKIYLAAKKVLEFAPNLPGYEELRVAVQEVESA